MVAPHVAHFTDQHGQQRRLVLRLTLGTTIPLFEQLRAQISVMVAVGRLEPGCRLPTVRQLAEQLRLAPGTVARTYRELENDGITQGKGRSGTFVANEPPHSEPGEERRERLQQSAQRFAFEVRQLGINSDQAMAAFEEAHSAEETAEG